MMAPAREPVLVFGENLSDPSLVVHALAGKEPPLWDARDSLQRLLAGKIQLPGKPPEESFIIKPENVKAQSMLLMASKESTSDLKIIWAETHEGFSAPLSINSAEIYTIRPVAPAPGGEVRIFGINLGTTKKISACLVDEGGKVMICQTGLSYRPENNISLAFERTLMVPHDIPPARYRLFINSGSGDWGWSRPFVLHVKHVPVDPVLVRCEEAPANGVEDASTGLQKAIHQAAAAGGGIVYLKAGIYLIKNTLSVENGVILRGAGQGATTLISPDAGQIPQMKGRYRPIVKLGGRSGLEHLTVDASPGEGHCAVWLPETTGASLRHCEIKNLTSAFQPEGKQAASGNVVLATGDTRSLCIEDCLLRGGYPFCHWGGEMADLTFRCNDCEAISAELATVGLHCLRNGVIEHNHIHGGGRGIVIAGEAIHSYFGYNLIDRIHGLSNGSEMFLYEMGKVLWQGKPVSAGQDSFTCSKMIWNRKAFLNSADGNEFTAYALITSGRGVGQCIPISSGTAGQEVKLERPWVVEPDPSSHIVVTTGCMENLHVANQFKDGVSYSGIYGSGSRNIWAGDEFERVSDGMVLWSLGAEHPVSMNVIRDLRLQERAGILLIGEFKTLPRTPMLLGNEIRSCQVYRRERNAGNEYGPGHQVWQWPFNTMPPGNARHSLFGSEAAIHFSAISGWPGSHHDEDPVFENTAAGASNLVWGSLAARSPVGIRIGKGFEGTAIVDFTSGLNDLPLSDSGHETYLSGLHEAPSKDR